jgi:hypothetical protein
MKMPGFTAEKSLSAALGRYRSGRRVVSRSGAVIPAIPACANCDDILDRCAANGGKPRAVCKACARGHCYSGEENPGGHCWYDGLHNKVICDL